VLGGDEPGSHKGRFWVYIGPTAFPYDVYDFTENRKRDGPAQFLANYAGYLQADAFSGYDGIYTGSDGKIVEVACWAHARRKFFETRSSSPAEASLILEMIRRLYEVEDRARPLDDAGRLAMRRTEAVPILERLREELDRLSSRLLPKSALAQAVTYALNQWQALCRYTEDGRLTIDNNVSERRLRDQAIGRNYAEFQIMRSCGSLTCPYPGKPAIRLRIIPYKPSRNLSSSGPGWNVPFCAGSSSKLSSARCFSAMSASTY
jgi:transposase